MNNIEVKVRRVCPECNGSGWVHNPVWGEFWERFGDELDRALVEMTPDQYHELYERRLYESGLRGDEPAELTCAECEGERYVEMWVPLAQLVEVNDERQ